MKGLSYVFYLVLVFILFSCDDVNKIDGDIIVIKGKPHVINNRVGQLYWFEEVDTTQMEEIEYLDVYEIKP